MKLLVYWCVFYHQASLVLSPKSVFTVQKNSFLKALLQSKWIFSVSGYFIFPLKAEKGSQIILDGKPIKDE